MNLSRNARLYLALGAIPGTGDEKCVRILVYRAREELVTLRDMRQQPCMAPKCHRLKVSGRRYFKGRFYGIAGSYTTKAFL